MHFLPSSPTPPFPSYSSAFASSGSHAWGERKERVTQKNPTSPKASAADFYQGTWQVNAPPIHLRILKGGMGFENTRLVMEVAKHKMVTGVSICGRPSIASIAGMSSLRYCSNDRGTASFYTRYVDVNGSRFRSSKVSCSTENLSFIKAYCK